MDSSSGAPDLPNKSKLEVETCSTPPSHRRHSYRKTGRTSSTEDPDTSEFGTWHRGPFTPPGDGSLTISSDSEMDSLSGPPDLPNKSKLEEVVDTCRTSPSRRRHSYRKICRTLGTTDSDKSQFTTSYKRSRSPSGDSTSLSTASSNLEIDSLSEAPDLPNKSKLEEVETCRTSPSHRPRAYRKTGRTPSTAEPDTSKFKRQRRILTPPGEGPAEGSTDGDDSDF